MTNFTKLTRWDADYYKELTDDDCIVCLSEREVYLLSEAIRAIRWVGTRWIGNITGLDFDEIASTLQHKLDERMTCQNLSQILEKVIDMEQIIKQIGNETLPPDLPDDIANSTITDVMTEDEIAEISAGVDVCDDAGKDAIYGACKSLVDYIHQVNLDSFEKISQIGNIPEQTALFISATPVGVLPFDEAFKYASFVVEELLQEYEATVDTELLENVVCDLFCIAVANDCNLTWNDIINYFGSKAFGSTGDYVNSLASAVEFALLGTVSGDQYFYVASLFQLISVVVADKYFDTRGIEYYSIILKTGLNSPDNDWTLLCDECPSFLRKITYNFNTGLNGWEIIPTTGETPVPQGTLTGDGIESVVVSGTVQAVQIKKTHTSTWRARAYKVHYDIDGTPISHLCRIFFRPTPDSQTGAVNFNPSVAEPLSCADLYPTAYQTGYNQIYLDFQVTSTGAAIKGTVSKIEIWYTVEHAPFDAAMIEDEGEICV